MGGSKIKKFKKIRRSRHLTSKDSKKRLQGKKVQKVAKLFTPNCLFKANRHEYLVARHISTPKSSL